MDKLHSFLKAIFATKISPMIGFGLICFLGIGISVLIIFSYSDPRPVFLGIQTVNADIGLPPLMIPLEQPITPEKEIIVSLKDQTLVYMEGHNIMGMIKISSGLARTPTPPGEYTVLKKKPVVNYRGAGYNYPNTKWNLMFKAGSPLNYYIHGAFWHNNFGHPMSHGCVNVSYADMEKLYNWADEGTKIIIENESLSLNQTYSSILDQYYDEGLQMMSSHQEIMSSLQGNSQQAVQLVQPVIAGESITVETETEVETVENDFTISNVREFIDTLEQNLAY